MKICITGAGGFLGSHLVDAAIATGHKVLAVSSYRSDGKTGWLPQTHGSSHLTVVRRDIRTPEWLHEADVWGAEVIVNAAALISVPFSLYMPQAYWETNANAVAMIVNQSEIPLVQISTSEVFDGKCPPYTMDDRISPITPYGASKAAAEMIVLAAGERVVRVFNMFGPRQYPRAVIPKMIREALAVASGEQEKARLYGPVGTRAFLYAPWVAQQIIERIVPDTSLGLVQLSSNQPYEIAKLWSTIAPLCGCGVEDVNWGSPPGNVSPVAKLYGDSSPGFETPGMPSLSDIQETVQWTKAQKIMGKEYCSPVEYQ